MSYLVNAVKSVEEIKKLSEEIKKENKMVRGKKVEIFKNIVNLLKPTLKHIDDQVIVSYKELPGEQQTAWKEENHRERGILLIDTFDKEFFDIDKISWEYTGYKLYLTLSGKIISVTREGEGFNDSDYGISSWESEVEELTYEELFHKESFEEIIKNIVISFDSTLESKKKELAELKHKIPRLKKLKADLERWFQIFT